MPLIVAGDLNVGRAPERLAVAHGAVARWLGSAKSTGGILRACIENGESCGQGLSRDAVYSMDHNKDWQIPRPGAEAALEPQRIEVPFGRGPDGTMLSDHVGYTVHYALGRPPAPPLPATLAMK